MAAGVGVALSPIHDEIVHFPGYFNNSVDLHSSESILIYLRVSGSVIPVRVLESDSIASVKLRLQTRKPGFVVKKQKLVFGGRELARNDSLVKDYGVTNGGVLHLILKLSDLLDITVNTSCGKEFEVQVDRYRNVGYLKQRIFKAAKGYVDLEDQELFCNGEKLDDQRVIDDISKNNDGVIHLLVKRSAAKVRATNVEKNIELSVVASNESEKKQQLDDNKLNAIVSRSSVGRDFWLEPVIVNPKIRLSFAVWDLINSTLEGLEKGNHPIRSSDGTGGAYFMRDPLGQRVVAIFKPIDEEPMAVHNPHGLPLSENGEGLKKGTRVGEGAFREVAAYILDHPKNRPRSFSGGQEEEVMGFSGVAPTAMVRCLHKGFNHPNGYKCAPDHVKVGSLQMFRENDGSCEDIGPNSFPVDEVHKISVLDIRLANADRHAGNILFRKGDDGRIELIPIDHGYCLPESFEDCTFDWLYWPQTKQPFSQETLAYINSLDAEQDLALLKFHGWDVPIECARTLRISTMLLKKGAERGLTPFTIGNIMCRETLNKESMIEEIVHEAQESMLPGMSEDGFLETVSQIMDVRLDELQ